MISLKSIMISGNTKIPDIKIENKQMIGVFGGTDSGKSALLLAILGQSINSISFTRTAEIDNREIAYIPTNVSNLFSCIKSSLIGEMKLSAQFLGRACPDVMKIAKIFNVNHLLYRNPFDLSGGEMVRAALAICAVKMPKIWLLDQIYDFLHPESSEEIHNILKKEIENGHTVIETHSSKPQWVEDFNYKILLDEQDHFNQRFIVKSDESVLRGRPYYNYNTTNYNKTLCSIKNVEYKYKNDGFKLGPISIDLREGDIIAITGHNGSGKTTLLQCIANLKEGMSGEISISGGIPSKKKGWLWARKAIYCFQNPDDQLYQPTVIDEIKTTLNALGRKIPPDIEKQLCVFGLQNYLNTEPYHLPRPLRRMVCLASTFMSGSPVLLLDEPTANLDYEQKKIIYQHVKMLSKNGKLIIFVSHDHAFVQAITNRILRLYSGKLTSHEYSY